MSLSEGDKRIIIGIILLWIVQGLFNVGAFRSGLELQIFFSMFPEIDIIIGTLTLIDTYKNDFVLLCIGLTVMYAKDYLIVIIWRRIRQSI